MAIKVGMVSLGCSKNQVDAERMLADLHNAGMQLCADPAQCQVVVVNTCGFIEDAKRESIETILEFAGLKKSGSLRCLVVTGCLSERYREQLAAEMPEVDVVLGIGANSRLVADIQRALSGQRVLDFGEKAGLSLEGERILINPQHFAYLKVAEGCDNRCSYCAIPLIRGPFRSRRMEDILEEAERLAGQGVVELNVVAQDTTRYGEDLYGRLMLPELLRQLCAIEKVRWVRVLYCYPDRVTDELLEVMAGEEKIVKYLDIPLQHINTGILHRMNRAMGREGIIRLLEKIRRQVPGVVLRTTLIAGLPGEGEAEFEELCRFVQETAFERLGCFVYSPEEDTPAAAMPGQVELAVRQRRADVVMQLQMQIAQDYSRALCGQRLAVLCEGFDGEAGCYVGRSYMDAPDIDTRVYFTSGRPARAGEFVTVEVTGSDGYDVVAEAVEE